MTYSAPDTLSKEAAQWWDKIVYEFDITDEAGFLLLQTAMESFDRMKQCQRRIKKDGQVIHDRFKQLRVHPLLAAERGARAQMLAALKALNLDLEPLRAGPGRPGG